MYRTYDEMIPLDTLVGSVIVDIQMTADREKLIFTTSLGKRYVYEAYGDCCSYSWIEHITGMDRLLNQVVLECNKAYLDDEMEQDSDYGSDVIRVYSYTLKTALGSFDIELRNSSNGYYGGSLELVHLEEGDFDEQDKEGLRSLTEDF